MELSNYDFLNKKYDIEDYLETVTCAIGILFFVYMLLIARDEPTMLLVIIFGIIFSFLAVVQNKYKNKYDNKLKVIANQVRLIKSKLNDHNNADNKKIASEEENIILEEENIILEEENKDIGIESLKPYNMDRIEEMLENF